jgi:Fic-DOC domain mobile mystery protein B
MKSTESAAGPVDAGAITDEEQSRLLPSLSTRSQLDEIESLAINSARVWAMRAAVLQRADLLTESFASELHRRMFGVVWRGAGHYRTAPRIPGWEPGHISEGVRLFLDDAEGWLRYSTYPVDETAVRLHHRLLSVRPWANGNGRHARLVADIVVASRGERPLAWGLRPAPVEQRSARSRYLDAIKAADAGEMEPLLAFARS